MGDDLDKAPNTGSGTGRLESLSISGFRGIDQLDIPKLARVTLLTGKNGVGKTTVLDAVRAYVAHGRFAALKELLVRREELITKRFSDDDFEEVPALDRLFHRSGSEQASMSISPLGGGPVLRIEERLEAEEETVDVVFNGKRQSYGQQEWGGPSSWFDSPSGRSRRSSAADTRCESLGPSPPGSVDLARLWYGVALTDNETLARDALRLVFGERVERAAVIGQPPHSSSRVVVKFSDHADPVPLKSLGDGATRMFGVSLALANCRDGILLLDEAENGIHYSLQSKFWGMILCAAEMHNVQVLATTHSKDCIYGFAVAALANPNVDCNLIRIGWRNGELRAVDYSTEELETAAEQDIEVR